MASRGGQKAVVVYSYQSHNRIIADEYEAKFRRIADSIRYHRSDTALVRVVVRIDDEKADAASTVAVAFVKAVSAELTRLLSEVSAKTVTRPASSIRGAKRHSAACA